MGNNPFAEFGPKQDNPFAEFGPSLSQAPISPQPAVAPEPKEGVVSSLVRGFKSYAPQLKETVGGLGVLAGKGIEEVFGPGEVSAGMMKSGIERMKAADEQQKAMQRPGESSFTQALDKGIGTVLSEWLPYQVGSGAANLLESLTLMGAGTLIGTAMAPGVGSATGAVTGAVAKEMAKKGVREAVAKIAATQGEEAAKKFFEKEALEAAKNVAISRGQHALLAGQAAGYGFGQVTSRAVQEAEQRGESPQNIELSRVIPAGMVSTAAEFISDKIGLGALKGLKKEAQDEIKKETASMLSKSARIAADAGKGILVTGTKETPTEIVQSMAERYGAKLNLADAKAINEYIDAAAASYAMSVVPGAVGGIKHRETAQAKPEPMAEQPAEQPRLALPSYEEDPYIVFKDGSVGKRKDVENYIASLPEDQQIAARAKLFGMESQPAETQQIEAGPLTDEQIQELEAQKRAELTTKSPETAAKPTQTEAPAPSQVVGKAPVSGRVEEGRTLRPEISPEPSIAEDRQRAAVAEPVAPPVETAKEAKQQHAVQGLGIFEVPVKDVQLSKEVPQFKSDADKAGVVEPLEGKFERTGVAPIQVWKRLDGRLEVISGRHRLDLAQRTGEATIPAQIHDEAAGFDATKAATLDAELNIRDGQGKVKDYVVYFDKSGVTENEAKSRGLLGRALGKRAWAIASKGSPELIAAHRGNIIDDAAAEAISNAAPGDARLQAVGIKAIQDGKNTANAVNMIQAVRAMTQGGAAEGTFDMFGFDDSAIKEAENMARAATRKQAEIDERLRAITGAAKRPEIAKKEGIDIRDPNSLKQRINELRAARAAWDSWAANPDLVAEVRQSLQPAGEARPEARVQPEGEGRAAVSDEKAGVKKSIRAETAQQVTDFEQTLRTTLNKFGLKDVGVKLIDGMRDEGSYAQQLIQIAADSANPIRTLRHEAIHALRELVFFTQQQWQSLSKMAKDKWIDQYLKQRNVDGKPLKAGEESRYDAYMREYNGDMEKITEEAVADAFADFDATKLPAGLMQALLSRLRNLFQSIKSALTKVESPEQIFGKVERGELAAGEAKPEAGARKSIREEPYRGEVGKEKPPTPTTAGQQALDTINQLGMGVKKPEPGKFERLQKNLETLGEVPPKDTLKAAAKKVSELASYFEGQVFSADAPFNNKLREGQIRDFKDMKKFIGSQLAVSQSQAVHADDVATQAMLIGKPEYREDLHKWVAVKDEANEIAKAKILDKIAEKYGLTKEEAVQIAHTYLSAANYEGILKRNEANKAKAEKLKDEGKDDEAEKAKAAVVYVSKEQAAMVKPGLEIANSIPEVKEITELWNKQRKNVKDVLVFTGLWTPEYAEAMMDNAAYVPFNREMEEESDFSPEMMIRGMQVKAKEHRLQGSDKPVANVFENMARWQQYAINRAIRNHKAVQMIKAAQEMMFDGEPMAKPLAGEEKGKNVARVWIDGKQKKFEMVDPLYLDAFKSLESVSIPSLKFFTAIANKLRQFIVLYPMFSVSQLSQDSVAAMFASGLKPQFALKIPYLAVKAAISTFRGTNNLHNELKNFGVVGVRDFNAAVSRRDAEITAGLKMPRGGMDKVKYVLERIAMSADNAVRQAVYEASMQQEGMTQAEALEKAFEIINFRRRGASRLINLIGQTVPFFYAYLSAQRVAYRTITGVGISPGERKAALKTFAYTSAAVMALSFIYAMANGDDEAYEKTPANIRDRSINIPGTNGFRIPLRPDFFLFPKIIAEHTYHLMAENGFSDPDKFKKAMFDNLVNATTSPNVTPQAFKPILEIGINYDFFAGKPIVGFFDQNKEASRQFNDSTSEFAKMMGGFGLSPQKTDHFIRGYFGTVGGLFLYGTNFFIEGEPNVPRPELSWEDMVKTFPGISAIKQKPTENALKVDFYELRDAIEKAKNTYDDIKKRSPEGLQDFIADEKNYAKLALEKTVTKQADHLSKIRRAIQQIAAAPEDRFSASEKQERIKELREVELQLLKSMNLPKLREMAKM